ncbi:MAG: formimidoylglutamase [Saprospiraceae bacterium]
MEEGTNSGIGVFQKNTSPDIWKGRSVSEELEPQYWYQIVQLLAIEDFNYWTFDSGKKNFVLLGYACDEGVRRNQGRVGAIAGPEAIRKQLAKQALHFQDEQLWDAGDIICINQDLEQAQTLLTKNIKTLLGRAAFPIVLGGGHDVAYGHGKGILDGLKPEQRLGIINFDAHFDLRPLEVTPNSGTPFYQLLTEANANQQEVDYLVLGLQTPANTTQLFSIAKSFSVDFIPLEDCQWHRIEVLFKKLYAFLAKVDLVYLTIDLDGFSAAFAPGVSAASPIGLEPILVMELLKPILSSKKLISMDIVELNPRFDLDQRTAKLAARLIEFLVKGLIDTKY